MSIPSATDEPRRIRRYARAWSGGTDSPYSPAFCIALLLIVGLAVKVAH